MNYIIFDLEWSNYYNYSTKTGINEVVEIGAIRLNESLEIVDTFKQLVKPTFAKKLSGRCKNLTKISNEDVKNSGISFVDAMADFTRWCGAKENVFLSWSNSDLYVLANNYLKVLGNCNISFIKYYCDAQKYCMSFIPDSELDGNNQIGLSKCADIFGISVDTQKLHRALADCYITAECLKKVFDNASIKGYINPCDSSFFERLLYKPYMIIEPHSNLFDIDNVKITCPTCGSDLYKISNVDCKNKAFNFASKCPKCNKAYWANVRAKKTYDDVIISTHIVLMNKKRAKSKKFN
ncbi:MAG: exonuclease domain-containing protein [Eubacterium sp.]